MCVKGHVGEPSVVAGGFWVAASGCRGWGGRPGFRRGVVAGVEIFSKQGEGPINVCEGLPSGAFSWGGALFWEFSRAGRMESAAASIAFGLVVVGCGGCVSIASCCSIWGPVVGDSWGDSLRAARILPDATLGSGKVIRFFLRFCVRWGFLCSGLQDGLMFPPFPRNLAAMWARFVTRVTSLVASSGRGAHVGPLALRFEMMPLGRLQGRPWVRCWAGEGQRVLPRVCGAGMMVSSRVVRSIGWQG